MSRDPKVQQQLLRQLPSVHALLEHPQAQSWLDQHARAAVVTAIRKALDQARGQLLAGQEDAPPAVETLLAEAERFLAGEHLLMTGRVINATGVVLHTGLGRAPLCPAAIEAIAAAAGGYCNLEYDLQTGRRGRRGTQVAHLLSRITGAQAALVVNNNAAATLLILQTFATGREVVVSRGELIEIGGSFRLPEIMRDSGAILREVGTTNRTHLADYANAINEQTAVLLKVHTSNYRVMGFTQSADVKSMAQLAGQRGVILLHDLGSGALFDLTQWGLPGEPYVERSLADGADLVCFSGDKLLGGPQCGIICGKADLIAQLAAQPLMRAVRVGKLTLLALEATLRHHLDPAVAVANVPALALLTADPRELADRADRLQELLSRQLTGQSFLVCSQVGYAGGGSLPTTELETVVVQWRPGGDWIEPAVRALRQSCSAVVARVHEGAILFDVRTVADHELEELAAAVVQAAQAIGLVEPQPE